MGLRIIDRVKGHVPVEVSEAERLRMLQAEAKHWAALRGQRQQLDIQRDFIDNFTRVKARTFDASQVSLLAQRIAERIRGLPGDDASAHSKVDVATLLELL